MRGDDALIANALRELRRRSGMTQEAAAVAAGVSPRVFRRVERTGTQGSSVSTLRAVFKPFDARVNVTVWWHGAELDRLLDSGHAAVIEGVIVLFRRREWLTATEVTFSQFGERGSIDVMALHPTELACRVLEIKTRFGSMEETIRRLDVKARLAPKLCVDRFGVRPRTVSRLLILPDDVTLRRVAARHEATLGAAFPARAREIRAWLRKPDRAIRGLWFLSYRTEASGRDDR